MKQHRWLVNVSSLALIIAFSNTPALNQSSILLPESSQRLAGGSDADGYKLVFPNGPNSDEFVEQLNKAGEQGYKLLSVMSRSQRSTGWSYYRAPVAILKLDSVQYEYASFITTSERIHTISDFEEQYEGLSKRGFHLVDVLVDAVCADSTNDGTCINRYSSLFLLQRQKGVEKPRPFILARSRPQSMQIMGAELTEQIKAKLGEGYYPLNVFSKSEILLTQMEKHELSTGNPDVRVVTNTFPRDVKGKINDLAKQGYRLLVVNSGIAVMYRRAGNAMPVSYEWVDSDKSDFEKRLLELQNRGAVYRMIYLNRDRTTKEKLILEVGAGDNQVRREYKVLRFEFQEVKDAGGKVVQIDLTPSSKETLKLMNNLAKEGFEVRELFKSKTVSVLLERSANRDAVR